MNIKLISILVVSLFLAYPVIAQDNKSKMTKKDVSEFTECVAVELYTVSPKAVEKGKKIDSITKIPEGWTLVGGAGGGGHPTMIVCR